MVSPASDAPQRLLRRGERLSDLALTAPGGSVARVSAHWQRRDLVLVFLGDASVPEALALLSDLARNYAAIQATPAEVMAVLQGTGRDAGAVRARLDAPFPILADPDGQAHRDAGAVGLEGEPSAAAYVLDRFGEVFFSQPIGADATPLAGHDLLGWLEYIELLCPE